LKRKQERREEAEGIKKQWGTSFKDEPWKSTTATMEMAPSLAKEAGDASAVGNNRACSNERSGENKCSDGMP